MVATIEDIQRASPCRLDELYNSIVFRMAGELTARKLPFLNFHADYLYILLHGERVGPPESAFDRGTGVKVIPILPLSIFIYF